MSHWNYRVIVKIDAPDKEPYFEIHECYYARKNSRVPNMWTEKPVSPIGDSPTELTQCLRRMRESIRKPALVQEGAKLKEWRGR